LSDGRLRLGAALACVAGLGIAGYLTWVRFADASLVCLAGGGCETVQESSYSEIAGVPVALLGLLGYTMVFGLLAWDAPETRLGAATFAFVGLAFSVYLLAVQAFVIEAFCVWCVANDVVVAPVLALTTALRLRSGVD
jgi:uncharacterized membrane protein